MLQQVEYRVLPFFDWIQRCSQNDIPLDTVMQRKELQLTKKAKLLTVFAYAVTLIYYVLIAKIIFTTEDKILGILFAFIFLTTIPAVLAFSLMVVVAIADALIVKPAERKMIAETKSVLQKYTGTTILVAGSYGKTTMKELLAAVLGSKLKIAATAGNRNTPSAHADFARSLTGEEDAVIFELGEGAPGDVRRFGSTLHPDMAIITGLAPNHLDRYGNVEELAQDFMTLKKYVDVGKLYFAADSELLRKYITSEDQTYSVNGGKSWQVSDIDISADKTRFVLDYKGRKLSIESQLLGRHQIAPLSLVAVIALEMGLTPGDVEAAIQSVQPYEHRMSSYHLNGATIIDDTYNGNLEGIMAGLSFLKEIGPKRKVYVTPGLVDQGDETDAVHRKIAAKIAEVAPDMLVLMRNSATDIISDELEKLQYNGEIQTQDNPLLFYQGLEHIVRAGDVVLMQNDWTDNYH
jgi:UDP-N-acetylmuramoyl-tripeptide--D-alanyl-D-alanine ligase